MNTIYNHFAEALRQRRIDAKIGRLRILCQRWNCHRHNCQAVMDHDGAKHFESLILDANAEILKIAKE